MTVTFSACKDKETINLSILDFKSAFHAPSAYCKKAINLSILDFKFLLCDVFRLDESTINLSILDFKSVNLSVGELM